MIKKLFSVVFIALTWNGYSQYNIQANHLFPADAKSHKMFGWSGALSSNGNTAVVSADPNNVGAFWIFDRTGTQWQQTGLFEGEIMGSQFGYSVAISADGNTIVAGAPGQYYNKVGWIYIYSKLGGTWRKYRKFFGTGYARSTANTPVLEGYSVAIAGDGNTVAVGAPEDNDGLGAVWTFNRVDTNWVQAGPKLVVTDYTNPPKFGNALALSNDGSTLVVAGVNDNSNGFASRGSTWIFNRSGNTWNEKAILNGEGVSVAISGDGKTVAVGSPYYYKCIWMYRKSGTEWIQVSKIQESLLKEFGSSVALSYDGTTLASSWTHQAKEPGGILFNGTDWGQKTYLDSIDLHTGSAGYIAMTSDAGTILTGFYDSYSSDGGAWIYGLKSSGISQEKESSGLSIYPNPSSNACTIYVDGKLDHAAQVQIFNMLGQPVTEVILLKQEQTSLDVSRLKNGIYLVEVTGKDFRGREKLVVRH